MNGEKVAAKKRNQEPLQESLTINPPNFKTAEFTIIGTAPYVQQAFSEKARNAIKFKQEKGSTSNKGTAKEAKDFMECYHNSMHVSKDGWKGIPAGAFRAAMISACRTVGFKMTMAKLSVFVEADGFDKADGTPLVKISKGEPRYCEHMVRIQQTVDVRARAMWDEGWEAKLRVRFDADQFTLSDLSNLLMRVGVQVGVGEGRPDSKSSAGMGWGTFALKGE